MNVRHQVYSWQQYYVGNEFCAHAATPHIKVELICMHWYEIKAPPESLNDSHQPSNTCYWEQLQILPTVQIIILCIAVTRYRCPTCIGLLHDITVIVDRYPTKLAYAELLQDILHCDCGPPVCQWGSNTKTPFSHAVQLSILCWAREYVQVSCGHRLQFIPLCTFLKGGSL